MSRIRGYNGIVRAGPSPTDVGEIRSWNYSDAAAVNQAGIMGTPIGDHELGQRYITGTVVAWWNRVAAATDPAPDAGQLLLNVGDEVALELHPNGTGSGKPVLTGTALISQLDVSTGTEDVVEATFSFALRGAWTESAQT